ncbi:MAG: hypothetical protein NXI24_16740 [bacterium]|nr:hypothetical protein [bacterium]
MCACLGIGGACSSFDQDPCDPVDISCSLPGLLLYIYNVPSIYVGATISPSLGQANWQVRRLDPDGALVWERSFYEGVVGSNPITAVSAAPDGGVFVYGISDLSGGGDHYLRKLTGAGVDIFERTWGQPGGESGASMDVDAAGNAYIVGTFNNGANDDWWLKKFDANGVEDASGWNKVLNGAANLTDTPRGLHVSTDGFVYVSGSMDDGAGLEGAIRKYALDGTEIIAGWNKRFGTNSNCSIACAMASDAAGNLYVAANLNVGNNNWYIRKFAPDGTEFGGRWPFQLDQAGGNDVAFSVRVGPTQEIIVSGWIDPLATGTQLEGLFLRLSVDGEELWRYRTNLGSETDNYVGVDVDAFGRSYFAGAVSFTGAPTNFDRSLLRLDSAGRLDSNANWQGAPQDAGFGQSDFYITLDIQ